MGRPIFRGKPLVSGRAIFSTKSSRCFATGSKKATASPASDGNNKKSKATRQTARLASAPYSAPASASVFCVCELVFGGGGGVGVVFVVWVGGLKVEKLDDLYLDDRFSS